MDGHQFRGARICRDMMLVSNVCRRALGCEWEEIQHPWAARISSKRKRTHKWPKARQASFRISSLGFRAVKARLANRA